MRNILVTGDHSVDYNIYLPTTDENPPPGIPPAKLHPTLGGAGIIYSLLKEIAAAALPKRPFALGFKDCQNSSELLSSPTAAVWCPQQLDELGGNEGSRKAKVWRLTKSLGLRLAAGLPAPDNITKPPTPKKEFIPDILVIEDDAVGFRFARHSSDQKGKKKTSRTSEDTAVVDRTAKYASYFVSKDPMPRWIIHKMTAPLCRGDLWFFLSRHDKQLADRLILIVTTKDLRRENTRISHGISWERTAEDILLEIEESPELAGLRLAKHLIVTCHGEGALWIERTDRKRPRAHFFFDPQHMEGEWSNTYARKGEAYGFQACFTASVAAHVAKTDVKQVAAGIDAGIRQGIWAMQFLRGWGHGPELEGKPGLPARALADVILTDDMKQLTEQYKSKIRKSKSGEDLPLFDFRKMSRIGRTEIPEDIANPKKQWRILENADAAVVRPPEEPMYGVARRIALFGLSALGEIPHARFKKVITVDREEIEALRNLRRLIGIYRDDTSQRKPLSLAVFGPPGAGKSFAIEQIAEELLGKDNPCLMFNLSQFHDAGDLAGAFHIVRDEVLRGHLPLVFWDEFDSREYYWLQYLLAPMQDGTFLQGEVEHPIGRCIFVFAGATSYGMEHFGPDEASNDGKDNEAWNEFKALKGPDFKSRLHGYFNVLGPNRKLVKEPDKQGHAEWKASPADVCFPVRRALLLRSMLGYGKREHDRIEIESGLLAALLETSKYQHGVRSIQRILSCLKSEGTAHIPPSSLPPDEVLAMNVGDLGEFKMIMRRARRFQQYAEHLASAIHRVYLPKSEKASPSSKSFELLDEETKADNFAVAIRIPVILELIGLYVVPAYAPEKAAPDEGVAQVLDKHMELLAEEEHNRWMMLKLENGWRVSTESEKSLSLVEKKSAKIHDCLIPYDKLPGKDKDKDRNSVKKFPEIVALAKFKIVAEKPASQV